MSKFFEEIDVYGRIKKEIQKFKNSDPQILLHLANQLPDVNQDINEYCNTSNILECLLLFSVIYNYYDIVKLVLVKSNRDLNIINNKFYPLYDALRASINFEKYDIIQLLLENNFDPNIIANNGYSIFCAALCKENIPLYSIQLLIDYGGDVNFCHKNTCVTALMLALKSNQGIDIIKLLLENGANVNTKQYQDGTALIVAIQFYDPSKLLDIINLLVKYGANIHTKPKNNANIIFFLAEYYNDEYSPNIIKYFVENKVSIHDITENRETLLKVAIRKNLPNLMNLFIKLGVDIMQKDDNGNIICIRNYINMPTNKISTFYKGLNSFFGIIDIIDFYKLFNKMDESMIELYFSHNAGDNIFSNNPSISVKYLEKYANLDSSLWEMVANFYKRKEMLQKVHIKLFYQKIDD